MNKKVLLISESSVYLNEQGKMIARGGGASCTHNIAKAMVELGFCVDVYSLKEFAEQKDKESIDGVNYERRVVSSRSSVKIFRYMVRAWLKSKDYHYVIVNQFLPHLLLPFMPGKFKLAIVHDVYMGTGGNFWVKQFGWVTGIIGRIVEWLQLHFDRWFADQIMTVSESSAEKIMSVVGKGAGKKIFINPNSIKFDDYICDAKKENVLLFVGRFVSYKHPEQLLYVLKKVLEKYEDFKAVFVVSRNFVEVMKNFERTRIELGLDSEVAKCVEFCGERELKEIFSKAKVLVQPSHMEGQGIVVLESLASGTPVVAYDLPAYRSMLVGGLNSELVEMGDKDALAEACIKVLGNYEYYQKNCDKTLERFSFDKFKERLFVSVSRVEDIVVVISRQVENVFLV